MTRFVDCTSIPHLPLLAPLAPLVAAAALAVSPGCGTGPHTDNSTETEGETEPGTTTSTTSESTTETTDPTTTTSDSETGGVELPPADIPAGCNPIAYEYDCQLPYPSDVFLVDDGSTPSGKRVELTEAATPVTMDDVPFNPMITHPTDGFSHHMPILALFPEGVDTDNLLFHQDDGAQSLDPGNTTILLNAETGEAVPHWAELDAMAGDDTARQSLIIRPYVRLDNQTRYIVALQGLADASGAEIEPPLGFAHILAGQTDGHEVLEPLADHYDSDIFPTLERHGVDRSALQLAWDFTTSSHARNTDDMLKVRELVMAAFENGGPAVEIDTVIPNHNEYIARRIEGRIEVPLYLEEDAPMALLHRDGDGNVAANGMHWVEFFVQIPNSAMPQNEDYTPSRILQYGHGFFGLKEEINYGSFMRWFSDEQQYVTAAVDWVGMHEPDQIEVVNTIASDPSNVFVFTDRLHQAFANQIALSYAIKTTFTEVPELLEFGQPVYNPDQLYWYGISQGSIFGMVFMALSPTIEKAVLSVGGGPYSLMMTRSGTFIDLFNIVTFTIGDNPLTIQKFIALSQHTWDRVDPSTYAPMVLQEPLAGSPERTILFQYGIGDHSVNNLASHLLMRAAGIPLIEPSAEAVYGVDTVSAPVQGSAATVLDFNLDVVPGVDAKLPSEDEKNDVHEDVRKNESIKAQINAFLQPGGPIEQPCDGPCDPD